MLGFVIKNDNNNWQYFTLGAKIHQIEIWNIDSKKYSETVISEYFGILLPNSDRGTNLSHLSDSVYSRTEYHTHLIKCFICIKEKLYFTVNLINFVNTKMCCYIAISTSFQQIYYQTT